MNKTVFVIGHRNPDTDSVVAAVAYAALKRATGMPEARAARAGAVNPQTEYIFDRFGLELPDFISDLVPRPSISFSGRRGRSTPDTPLWTALALLGEGGGRPCPSSTSEGRYRSPPPLRLLRPERHRKDQSAQEGGDPDERPPPGRDNKGSGRRLLRRGRGIQGEYDSRRQPDRIGTRGTRGRERRQQGPSRGRPRGCPQAGHRSRHPRPHRHQRLRRRQGAARAAESKRISVLVSPYDTSGTSLLVLYSTPVLAMGDAEPSRSIRESG